MDPSSSAQNRLCVRGSPTWPWTVDQLKNEVRVRRPVGTMNRQSIGSSLGSGLRHCSDAEKRRNGRSPVGADRDPTCWPPLATKLVRCSRFRGGPGSTPVHNPQSIQVGAEHVLARKPQGRMPARRTVEQVVLVVAHEWQATCEILTPHSRGASHRTDILHGASGVRRTRRR